MLPSCKVSTFTLLASFSCLSAAFAQSGYDIKDDKKLKHLDVMQSGKLIGRYFYDYDDSSGKRREDTFKTFLQLYNPTGDLAITKALGGEFNHHRGIFIGWNKITIDGQAFDCWHGHGGAQLHQDFSKVRSEKRGASFSSRLLWEKGKNGPPVIEEKRTMTFLPAPATAYAMLDFSSTLKALDGKTVTLDGDPEHAGIQLRAPSELDRSKTRYLYPRKNADAHRDLDYPWLACSYVLGEKTYSVVQGRSSPASIPVRSGVSGAPAIGRPLLSAVCFDEFIDQAGGFHLVEKSDALAEAIDREPFDRRFVEMVLRHEILDEIPLLCGALPLGVVGSLVGAARWRIAGRIHPVITGRDKAGLLDLLVDRGLEQFIEAEGFPGDIIGGNKFRFDRDGELVGRVTGKPEPLAVICDQFDGHGWLRWG